ncbi:ribonuclease H-like domain-containing protein [Tanacetum coccineum]|uniref:Ribonuclease H-like domain-containing protein n=1 Tax=Tanacetum coccineum TaxID=301880 RepID=A0ABQ5FJ11_9ASTR
MPCWQSLSIPKSISMAEIVSKEAQKKSKAGICFRFPSHNKHTSFLLSKRSTSCKSKTSAINRAFCIIVPAGYINSPGKSNVVDYGIRSIYLLYGSAGVRVITAAGGRSYKENNRLHQIHLLSDDSPLPGVNTPWDVMRIVCNPELDDVAEVVQTLKTKESIRNWYVVPTGRVIATVSIKVPTGSTNEANTINVQVLYLVNFYQLAHDSTLEPDFKGYGPEFKKTSDTPLVEELVSEKKKQTVFPKQQDKTARKPTFPPTKIQLYGQCDFSKAHDPRKQFLISLDFQEFDGDMIPLVEKVKEEKSQTVLELRPPALSFMRPFGCHVSILNTLDHLGKFDGKYDDGFFVGYSLTSKAFRVYNIRTRKVEENLHIRFLEDKPIVSEDGPKWLFDIDSLTKSMNYVPVIAGTNFNDFAGLEVSIGKGTDKAKITRKQSKPDKHEHENGRARKGPGESYQKSKMSITSSNVIKPTNYKASIGQTSRREDTWISEVTQREWDFTPDTLTQLAH